VLLLLVQMDISNLVHQLHVLLVVVEHPLVYQLLKL